MKQIQKNITRLQAQAIRRGLKHVVKTIEGARVIRFDAHNSEFPDEAPRLIAQNVWWRKAILQALKLSDLELAKVFRRIQKEHRFYLTNKKYELDRGLCFVPCHSLFSTLFWYESKNIIGIFSTIRMPKPVYDYAQSFLKENGYWNGVMTMKTEEVIKIETSKLRA